MEETYLSKADALGKMQLLSVNLNISLVLSSRQPLGMDRY